MTRLLLFISTISVCFSSFSQDRIKKSGCNHGLAYWFDGKIKVPGTYPREYSSNYYYGNSQNGSNITNPTYENGNELHFDVNTTSQTHSPFYWSLSTHGYRWKKIESSEESYTTTFNMDESAYEEGKALSIRAKASTNMNVFVLLQQSIIPDLDSVNTYSVYLELNLTTEFQTFDLTYYMESENDNGNEGVAVFSDFDPDCQCGSGDIVDKIGMLQFTLKLSDG